MSDTNGSNGNGHGENLVDNLVTMPGRNGGRLTVGGRKGGRTPSVLRARMRGALAKRIGIAREIADDPKQSTSDRLKALDFLAKYGLGTTVTETDTEGRNAIRVIREPRKAVSDN